MSYSGYPEDDIKVYIEVVFGTFCVILLDLCHLKMTFSGVSYQFYVYLPPTMYT